MINQLEHQGLAPELVGDRACEVEQVVRRRLEDTGKLPDEVLGCRAAPVALDIVQILRRDGLPGLLTLDQRCKLSLVQSKLLASLCDEAAEGNSQVGHRVSKRPTQRVRESA